MKEPAMGWKKRAEELANENAELVKKLAESDNAPLDIAMAVAGANARIAELETAAGAWKSAAGTWEELGTRLSDRVKELEAELLRVRTTGHAAAHELDNIAIECGLGHSPKPGTVAAHVRELKKWAELYPLAWDECKEWREWCGYTTVEEDWMIRTAHDNDQEIQQSRAHDQARAKAGVV